MAIVVAGSIDVYRTTTSDLISGEFWGVGHSFGVKNKNMKFTDCFYQALLCFIHIWHTYD